MRVNGNLVCTVPGCGRIILALSGLEELTSLKDHMLAVHLVKWTFEETLRNREIMERRRTKEEA